MASAVSPSRKRKSSATQSTDGSSARKKSREGEKSGESSSSQSKRSKSKSKKDIKASLKTVSELAKLVTSGAVQVPKSLVNYTSDKALLLDQVFTILSPNDINGMLPDILKGLKLKRVKSLCYEQLKGMSEEEIKHALQPEDYPASTSASSEITSSSSNQTQAGASSDKTDTTSVKIDRQTVETESKRELDPQSCDSEKDGKEETLPEHSQTLGGLETVTQTQRYYTENVIHVSDVSADEEDTNVKKSEEAEDVDRNRTHGKAEQPNKDGNEGAFRVEEEKEKSVESDKDDIHDEPGEGGVCTSLEVGDDSDVVVSELDAGQLLEMEMRRRALESELKKMSSSTDHKLSRKPESQPDQTMASDLDEDYIEVCLSDSEALDKEIGTERGAAEKTGTLKKKENEEDLLVDGGVGESNAEIDTVDAGDLLERLLRQKALQSLLTKKKQKAS